MSRSYKWRSPFNPTRWEERLPPGIGGPGDILSFQSAANRAVRFDNEHERSRPHLLVSVVCASRICQRVTRRSLERRHDS